MLRNYLKPITDPINETIIVSEKMLTIKPKLLCTLFKYCILIMSSRAKENRQENKGGLTIMEKNNMELYNLLTFQPK